MSQQITQHITNIIILPNQNIKQDMLYVMFMYKNSL